MHPYAYCICKQHMLSRCLINISPLCNLSDPDSVAFCVLATDEEYECDIALQIHFTLIQAFCFDNDINIVRVNDIERLANIVGSNQDEEPKDVHCMLVTVSCSTLFCILTYTLSTPTFALHLHVILISLLLFFFSKSPSADSWKDSALERLGLFCEESRNVYEWVPTITLPER